MYCPLSVSVNFAVLFIINYQQELSLFFVSTSLPNLMISMCGYLFKTSDTYLLLFLCLCLKHSGLLGFCKDVKTYPTTSKDVHKNVLSHDCLFVLNWFESIFCFPVSDFCGTVSRQTGSHFGITLKAINNMHVKKMIKQKNSKKKLFI